MTHAQAWGVSKGYSPDVPHSGEQGTLHCRELGLFLCKVTTFKAESIPGILNTQKQTQKGRQNEETQTFMLNEGTGHSQWSK